MMSMQFLCTFVIQLLRHLSKLINNNYKYIDMAREKTAVCRAASIYLHEAERTFTRAKTNNYEF